MSGGKGGSQPSGNTTTTSTNEPWGPQQPFLLQGLNAAQNLYNTYTPQYYPNATYATPMAAQNNGLDYTINDAEVLQNSGIPMGAVNANTGLSNGSALAADPSLAGLQDLGSRNIATPANSPGMATLNYAAGGGMTDPFLNQVAQTVAANTLPGIESQFISGGSLASPQAAFAASSGLTSAIAPTISAALQAEQQNQLGAAQNETSDYLAGGALENSALSNLGTQYGNDVTKQIQSLALEPQTLSDLFTAPSQEYSAGSTQQALNQAAINDAVQRWNYGQTLPYSLLNQFEGETSGNFGGSSSTVSPYFSNPTANLLSGAAGGGVLGNMLFPAASATATPFGGIAGAGLGAILALMSDRRLKRDIKFLKRTHHGLGLYRFRYLWSEDAFVGVMAQEVAQVMPDAVTRGTDGVLRVFYHRLGLRMQTWGDWLSGEVAI